MSDAQDAPEIPQIYLITPPEFDPAEFTPKLERILDAVDIACVRLSMATQDEDDLSRAADQTREIAHARDIPLIIASHLQLVEKLGLDGVHLADGARSIRYTRKELGADTVIGTFCGPSRHEGMSAGENGADYISLGPVGESLLGDGSLAEVETFEWWSKMIELPIVAEGNISTDVVERLAPFTDFFAIGPEIWSTDDPLTTLKELISPLG
ncbi:MAG: thiamine phosphate synthase [Litoreibacter sp.]